MLHHFYGQERQYYLVAAPCELSVPAHFNFLLIFGTLYGTKTFVKAAKLWIHQWCFSGASQVCPIAQIGP